MNVKYIGKKYQKYLTRRNTAFIAVTILLLLALPVIVIINSHNQNLKSNAAGAAQVEPENGTIAGNVMHVNDANASGGKYLQFGNAVGASKIALGVFPGNTSGNPLWDTSHTALNAIEAQIGNKHDFVVLFKGASDNGGCIAFPTSQLNTYIASGYKPLVTIEFNNWQAAGSDSSWNLDSIINGSRDTCIRSDAQAIAQANGTVYVRIFHEMNGDWYPWGDGVNGNTPAKLVSAWRHVYNIFQSSGATNTKFIFAPNISSPNYTPAHSMASFYPGDAYVDYLGLDGYNWFTTHGDPWYSFDQLIGPSYNELTALDTTSPVIITETASVEGTSGTAKADWINAMRISAPANYPRLVAVAWFNSNQEGANWRIDSSTASINAYQTLSQDQNWKGTLGTTVAPTIAPTNTPVLPTPTGDLASRLFTGDFETGNGSQWGNCQNVYLNNPCTGINQSHYAIQIQNSVKRQGNYAARFEVRDGDIPNFGGGERSEVASGAQSGGQEGDDRWYQWSTQFGNTLPATSWSVISQWHDQSNASPPLMFVVSGPGEFGLKADLQSSPGVYLGGVTPWKTAMNPGTWHDIKIHVKWSTNPSVGFVELWHNGVRQTFNGAPCTGQTRCMVQTLTPGGGGTYFKQGYYRDAAMSGTAVIYHDGFTAATTEAGLGPL